jgi:hypothetical protein
MMRTLVWDVDDVLNDLTGDWFRHAWSPAHPVSLTYDDLVQNPPHEVLNVPLDTYLASLDAFRRDGYRSLAPVPEVVDWFAARGSRYRHVALTAVPQPFAHVSAEWVARHFGAWINTIAFVTPTGRRADAGGMAASKRDYLEWFGHADVIVEDRAQTIASVASLGIAGILVPRPWNERRREPVASALRQLSSFLDGAGDAEIHKGQRS